MLQERYSDLYKPPGTEHTAAPASTCGTEIPSVKLRNVSLWNQIAYYLLKIKKITPLIEMNNNKINVVSGIEKNLAKMS